MSNEDMKRLAQRVQDTLSDKHDEEKYIYNEIIDYLIKRLELLKMEDIPNKYVEKAWHDFLLGVGELYQSRGKISAYYYSKNVSEIMKEQGVRK